MTLRSIKRQKRTRSISSHLDQTRLVNNEVIARTKGKIFLAGPTREIPSEYRGIEYHRSGCQSECRIRFMPPARGLSHIIRRLNVATQRSLSQRELKVMQTISTKSTSLQRLLVLAEIPYIDCCLNISTTA